MLDTTRIFALSTIFCLLFFVSFGLFSPTLAQTMPPEMLESLATPVLTPAPTLTITPSPSPTPTATSLRKHQESATSSGKFAVDGIKTGISVNQFAQRVFTITANSVSGIDQERLTNGFVGWGFVPATMDVRDFQQLREHLFINSYGFSNDPENGLIIDALFPQEPVRIAIFQWICLTADCDGALDIFTVQFISSEAVNYNNADNGSTVELTQYPTE